MLRKNNKLIIITIFLSIVVLIEIVLIKNFIQMDGKRISHTKKEHQEISQKEIQYSTKNDVNDSEKISIIENTPLQIREVIKKEIPTKNGYIPLWIHKPDTDAPLPVIIYYHGGAWRSGSTKGYEKVINYLASNTPAVVVSPDYRLAPENPFPACIDDCYASLNWVKENISEFKGISSKIAVCGDSSGGNIAAAVSLRNRDLNKKDILHQILFYPILNIDSLNTSSYTKYKEGYGLNKTYMEKIIKMYVPNERDRKNPYASPLLAKDFKNLPQTFLIAADLDVLKDEGVQYIEKLKKAGIKTKYSIYENVRHAFLMKGEDMKYADKALNEAVESLRIVFFK